MAKLSKGVGPEDHVQGSANAAVTLVEYGDYECPSCGEAYSVVKQLQSQFGRKLRFVYRNFPLPQHEFAMPAAEAAEFAATEDRFWEMHDALYENQDKLNLELLPRLAKRLGLDTEALEEVLEDEAFADRIEDDMKSGEASGLRGTPTFYINGLMHSGSYDYETLSEAIESAA